MSALRTRWRDHAAAAACAEPYLPFLSTTSELDGSVPYDGTLLYSEIVRTSSPDTDGDGRPDAIEVRPSESGPTEVVVRRAAGDVTFAVPVGGDGVDFVPTAWGDFDGDGRDDLLC